MALGADPTASDAEGLSPQHHAAADGQRDVLAALMGLPPSSEEVGLPLSSEQGAAMVAAPPLPTAYAPSAAQGSLPPPRLVGHASSVVEHASPADSLATRGIPAIDLVGQTPLSLSIIRRKDACTDLLLSLAEGCGPHELLLYPALPPVAATMYLLPAPPTVRCRDPAATVRDNAAAAAASAAVAGLVDSDALAGLDWAKAGLKAKAATAEVQDPEPQCSEPMPKVEEGAAPPLPQPLTMETSLPAWPLEPLVVRTTATVAATAAATEISIRCPSEVAAAVPAARWVPSGLVSGLVEEEDNVLRSYMGNNSIEAWLWHVDGAPQHAGTLKFRGWAWV